MKQTLRATNLPELGERLEGKVRDIYLRPREVVLVATDRHSSFDRIIAYVPGKGEVLWRSIAVTSGDLIAFVDSDLIDPDPRFVPKLLGPLLTYLNVHRPQLAAMNGRWAKPVEDALWVSADGSPMTEMAIYDRIRAHTGRAFGAAINPHLFRDAAATTLAIADPAHVRVAAPLLGHRTFLTTERHYQHAQSFDAHRAYVDAVFGKGKSR